MTAVISACEVGDQVRENGLGENDFQAKKTFVSSSAMTASPVNGAAAAPVTATATAAASPAAAAAAAAAFSGPSTTRHQPVNGTCSLTWPQQQRRASALV